MPENTDLRVHLATLQLESNILEEAKDNFEKVLRLDSENKEALFGLGKCCYLLKDLSDARIFLGKLLKSINNNHAEANLIMAEAYADLGDPVTARDYYTRAVNLDPKLASDEIRKKIYQTDEDKEELESSQPSRNTEPVRMYIEGYEDDEEIESNQYLYKGKKITFNDVGGLDTLKETIRHKIIHPFKNPEVFKSYGKKPGGGILLYGPPGCGKTFIARATAGECDASFITIEISDVLDMWMGESEKKLHNLFAAARNNAPTVIFIDEIDALGSSRQSASSSSIKMLVNQLLSEMDGMNSDNDQVLIIGATNSPWFVDPALKRPGRFDRVVFVSPPDLSARIEILHLLTQDIKIAKFDFKKIAKLTTSYSGADLKALIEMASEDAINEALNTGIIRDITEKDFLNSIKKMNSSTKEWFSTAKNYATYSNQGGQYDDILEYINKNLKL